MLDKILVPVDGSPLSEEILQYVEALGGPKAAPITLAHALDPRAAKPGLSPRVPSQGLAVDEAESRARDYLQSLAERLRARRIPCDTALLHGPPANAIVGYARREGFNLIAMTTHGRSGVGRWVFGSVAEKVLHHARIPVFLVRPHDEGDLPQSAQVLRRVLVPLDGSEIASQAVPYAVELARCLDLRIELAHVARPRGTSLLAAPQEQDDSTAKEYLEEMRVLLQDLGLRVRSTLLEGDPGECVVEAAHALPGTVVILASHGQGMNPGVLGRTAERITRAVDVPALLVRPITELPIAQGFESEAEPAPA